MNSNTSSDIDIPMLDKNGRMMDIPSFKKETSDTDLYLNLIANPSKSRQDTENSTSSLHFNNDNKELDTSSVKRMSLHSLKQSPAKRATERAPRDERASRHTEHRSERHTEHKASSRHSASSHRSDSSRARYESVDVSDRSVTPVEPKLTPQQIRMKKTDLLRKLCDLKAKGYKLTKEYDFNSDITEMEYEYELLKGFQQRRDGIKLYKNTIVNICNLVEFFNGKYDPFGADLNGWSEHMSVEVDSYDEVLEELYEKYKSTGKSLPPELKLLILIGFSASAFHFSKKHISNMPSGMMGGLQSGIAQKIAGMGKEKSRFKTEQEINIERQKEEFRQKEREMKEAMRAKFAQPTRTETEMPAPQVPQSNLQNANLQNANLQNAHHPVNFSQSNPLLTSFDRLGPPNLNIATRDPRPLVTANSSVQDVLKRLHERDADTQETQEEYTANNDRLLSDTTASESKKRGRKKKNLMTIQ
jgi:hypothetical protein